MKQIHVVGAVMIHDGAVLAAQRSHTMSLPKLWEFPGGKIEEGESPQDALVREVREELTCHVSIGERLETTTHEYDFGVVTLTTFYAVIVDGDPRPTEHAELRWIPIGDLRSVVWAPADLPAVYRLLGEYAA